MVSCPQVQLRLPGDLGARPGGRARAQAVPRLERQAQTAASRQPRRGAAAALLVRLLAPLRRFQGARLHGERCVATENVFSSFLSQIFTDLDEISKVNVFKVDSWRFATFWRTNATISMLNVNK